MITKISRKEYNHNDAEQGFLNLYYGQQAIRLPHVYNGNLAIKTKSRKYWDAIQDQMRIVSLSREEVRPDPISSGISDSSDSSPINPAALPFSPPSVIDSSAILLLLFCCFSTQFVHAIRDAR